MVKNNHSCDNRSKLDSLLRSDVADRDPAVLESVLSYARSLAKFENALVVVSDMAAGRSHIIAGGFARNLDIGDYSREESIWERRILSLMSPEEQERKYIAELRFFHFLRHLPPRKRPDYFLMSKLRFRFTDGRIHDVLHRMFYVFDETIDAVRYAVCIYGHLTLELSGESFACDSVTGAMEGMSVITRDMILSPRERQVLALIDTGLKSAEIADRLHISPHTVSRHRQQIIARLQVKNTHEACRVAKSLHLI